MAAFVPLPSVNHFYPITHFPLAASQFMFFHLLEVYSLSLLIKV
jgi:hypothetical protein